MKPRGMNETERDEIRLYPFWFAMDVHLDEMRIFSASFSKNTPNSPNLCHEYLKYVLVFSKYYLHALYIHMLDTFRQMRPCKIDGANNGNNANKKSRPFPLSSPFGKCIFKEQTREFVSSDSCIIHRMGPFRLIMTGEVAAATSIVIFSSPN